MGHPSTAAPTVILADACYPRRGAIIHSGLSETRIREAMRNGLRIPWLCVGKRKFVKGADLIWFIEKLAELEASASGGVDVTPETLHKAIGDLARLEREGLLDEFEGAFTHECRRRAGTLPTTEWRRRMASWESPANVDKVSRVASNAFALPLAECKRIAERQLEHDEFADIAIEIIEQLIAGLAPVPASQPQPTQATQARRKW